MNTTQKSTLKNLNKGITLDNIRQGKACFQKDNRTKSSDIALVQQALNGLGFNAGTADGIYGENTKKAVMAFQESRALRPVDGLFGRVTLLELEKALQRQLGEEPKTEPIVENKPTPSFPNPSKLDFSNDFSDDVKNIPTYVTYGSFSVDKAVAYAQEHSVKKPEKGKNPKANPHFHESGNNDCANFVHQCLLAGGLKMFDGWCYKLQGVPKHWRSEAWKFTNQGRRRLLEKGWITRVELGDVKIGDIVYSYNQNYKAKNMTTPFTHVTIITSIDREGRFCVCGHTDNHKEKPKPLSKQTTYVYRVNKNFGLDGTELAIDLMHGCVKD